MPDDKIPILVPLTEKHLDLLQWFGEWIPEDHRESWEARRAWPPGWRYMPDRSVYNAKIGPERDPAPHPKQRHNLVHHLMEYGLVEGSYRRIWRLTPRGRCALKLANRTAPDRFESHCEDIFDHVSLLPILDPRYIDMHDPHGPYFRQGYHSKLPDDVVTWNAMLIEYNDSDYHGKGTLTRASARLSAMSGQVFLNGSLREHHRWLRLSVGNSRGRSVCEVDFTLEGFMELMTSNSSCPATLGHYRGSDGMDRAEPCPRPVSIRRRMEERLKHHHNVTDQRLDELAGAIEAAKMAKGLKASLLHEIHIIKGNTPADYSFAAQQAVEEVSCAVESLMSIASERIQLHGAGPAAALLPDTSPEQVFALIEGRVDEPLHEEE